VSVGFDSGVPSAVGPPPFDSGGSCVCLCDAYGGFKCECIDGLGLPDPVCLPDPSGRREEESSELGEGIDSHRKFLAASHSFSMPRSSQGGLAPESLSHSRPQNGHKRGADIGDGVSTRARKDSCFTSCPAKCQRDFRQTQVILAGRQQDAANVFATAKHKEVREKTSISQEYVMDTTEERTTKASTLKLENRSIWVHERDVKNNEMRAKHVMIERRDEYIKRIEAQTSESMMMKKTIAKYNGYKEDVDQEMAQKLKHFETVNNEKDMENLSVDKGYQVGLHSRAPLPVPDNVPGFKLPIRAAVGSGSGSGSGSGAGGVDGGQGPGSSEVQGNRVGDE